MSRRRLLIVDDETFLTEMLEIGLGRLGYDTVTANDPTTAFDIFQRDPARFDAIISDQIMPKMTGLALLGKIRSLGSRVPFILCSGYADDATEDTAAAAGASAFFTKPVMAGQLDAKLKAVLAEG